MATKIIDEVQIKSIKELLLKRNSYKEIKNILDSLENSKEELILKDIRDLRNHHGKSTLIDADLDKIINKYGEEDVTN